MKRILAALLLAILSVAIIGCSGGKPDATKPTGPGGASTKPTN